MKLSEITKIKMNTQTYQNHNTTPYKSIGTTNSPTDKYTILNIDSDIFGSFIGQGSEQQVFQSARNPNEVLKVIVGQRFRNPQEIRNFHPQWFKRNQIPMQERMKFQGYLTGDGRVYPVYSQQKLLVTDDPIVWRNKTYPAIKKMMQEAGFTGEGTFTNGKLTVGDISPNNVGFRHNGEVRLFDANVYREGGLFSR